MNERIQELHEQAMKSCDKHRSDILNYHRIYREKFAELIVRECCDWIDGSPTGESGCQLLLTKSFIIANLKGHFGL